MAEEKAAPAPTKRRDAMIAIETAVQAEWAARGAFDACAAAEDDERPKFMVTFPYPYMNGRLHLGHAFSLTKAEFAACLKRLQGYNVLFPFGFHCTGMPIQAAANKLEAEMAKFGNPPVFPAQGACADDKASNEAEASVDAQMAALAKKGKAKKAKVAQKGVSSYQWQSLEKMGIPACEIASFRDTGKWLEYFPPLGVSDLQLFGASVDWRRSFLTTEQNPYYDSFVRWQFQRLRAMEKIAYGKRANVYSVLDKMCCADHDRASGEGVGSQEYTLVKLQMLEPLPEKMRACAHLVEAAHGKGVFLVPATLRCETMYGQTNCYVLPEGEYGFYEQANGEVYVMSHRAAVGVAHQGTFVKDTSPPEFIGFAKTWGQTECLLTLKGADLIGAPLKAPLASFERVYVLPLFTISMTKGTGVVTSVPSDAPDDWVALHELKTKPDLRAKFGLTLEQVDFPVVPVIRVDVPSSGGGDDGQPLKEGWSSDVSAEYWCERLKIKGQNDAANLKTAKGETYLNGFNYGKMLVGEHAGKPVSVAKLLVKDSLLASGDALPYFEPESPIVSRTGDDCIVAHTEQWYLKYGEPAWRAAVEAHVDGPFEAYNPENLARFKYTLGWMKEWACSREFGLGSRIPWDDKWLIESLSDSTIYMAYYTVAHLLQGGSSDLDGSKSAVDALQLTPACWDFIMLKDAVMPSSVSVALRSLLECARREFRYWYPLDLRVSGKDLIGNHLTMSLYNHAAVWPDEPELWPRAMYCNGFVLLDGAKMSKSTGNFLLLEEACKLYGTDAVRFALADAGDTLEDANFERKKADGAVSMLYVEEAFAREICAQDNASLRALDSPQDAYFVDTCFRNEMQHLANETTEHFQNMRWRDGLQSGVMKMQLARDSYRDWCFRSSVPMHAQLCVDWVELSATLIAPICPHFSTHIWSTVLRKPTALLEASQQMGGVWPASMPVDKQLERAYGFLKSAARSLRMDAAKDLKSKKGPGPKTFEHATIFIASSYPEWKRAGLTFLRAQCADGNLKSKATLLAALKSDAASPTLDPRYKPQAKLLMQFSSFMIDYAHDAGIEALDEQLPFDQHAVLSESLDYLKNQIIPGSTLVTLEIVDVNQVPDAPGPDKKKLNASPANPTIYLH